MGLFSRNITVLSGKVEKEKAYWMEKLSGDLVNSSFPPDFARTEAKRKIQMLEWELPEKLTEKISYIGNSSYYGIYSILLSGLYYLLSRYSDMEDLIIGTPVFVQDQDMSKDYVNEILILRNRIHSQMTFKQLLFQTKEVIEESVENMNFPFDSLLEMLNIKEEKGRLPLFDIIAVFENLQSMDFINILPYDIAFCFCMKDKRLGVKIYYNAQLYKSETIKNMYLHYINSLNSMTENHSIKIAQIEMLNEKEKRQLLWEFNNTFEEYDKSQTIQKKIELQAERKADYTALICETETMTYEQLNQKANQLAWLLKGHGIEKGDAVGLLIPRSNEMIVGMLGILKAGAVCVPLDVNHPCERTNNILKDSGAKILLKRKDVNYFEQDEIEIVYYDCENLSCYPSENLINSCMGEDICFYIYTSGSTGLPKGAMLHHNGIINHALTKIDVLGITEKDIIGNNFSINVIASLWQIFSPLFLGGKLVIHSEKVETDPYLQFQYLVKDRVNVIELIPSVLNTYLRLLDEGKKKIELPFLKTIALTSEETKPFLVNRFYKQYQVQLVNCYGQTECSDDTLHYVIPKSDNTKQVPIGTPSKNTRVYIVGRNLNLQSVGIPGELCISGDGLAKGYRNREDLTAQKFVENPFSEEKFQKIYRTGDLARWLPDGTIEYMGRLDYQVKIRGFRIELGEIESRLLSHKDIIEAVVAAKESESGEKYLCAYITAKQKLVKQSITEFLTKTTPSYMIPAYIIQLDNMPLTPNGKVNKKALPDPKDLAVLQSMYIEPETKIEIEVVNIFKEILEVDKVGVNSNFFELGGHSLKAVLLRYAIQKKYKINISLAQIFQMSTVKDLVEYIETSTKITAVSIQPAEIMEWYPLSYAQKRIFIHCHREGVGTSYNMSEAFEIKGKFDGEKMEKALSALVRRHEILRTTFELKNGEPVQIIHDHVEIKMEYYDINNEFPLKLTEMAVDKKVKEIISQFSHPFNLNKIPLVRVGLIKVHSTRNYFVFDLHHIISDGISMQVFGKELFALYNGDELPKQILQYKDFSQWQNQMMKSEVFLEKEKFWIRSLKREDNNNSYISQLPTDYKRTKIPTFEGETIYLEIGEGLTKSLNVLAAENNSTLFMVLLSVLKILIARYNKKEDVVIGSPVSGRNREDLESVMGMFFNMIAIRSFPMACKSYRTYLHEVRKICIACYDNQDYPFIELVDKLLETDETDSNLLFNVVFIMQNMNLYLRNEMDMLTFTPYLVENKTAKHELQLEAVERDGCIHFSFIYNTNLFKRDTIKNLIDGYHMILEQIVKNYDIRLMDLQMVSNKELNETIIEFNAPL